MCNLLETTMFSSEACVGLDDSALDLTDYCVRNLSLLICSDQLSDSGGGGGVSAWAVSYTHLTLPTKRIV